MQMEKSTESRKSLKAKLKWGDMTKVAQLAKVDLITVDRWFKHKSNNGAIRPAVEALLKAREEKMKEALKQMI